MKLTVKSENDWESGACNFRLELNVYIIFLKIHSFFKRSLIVLTDLIIYSFFSLANKKLKFLFIKISNIAFYRHSKNLLTAVTQQPSRFYSINNVYPIQGYGIILFLFISQIFITLTMYINGRTLMHTYSRNRTKIVYTKCKNGKKYETE